ncbi:DUF1236 domain-containing protein [Fulvimarina sp. 2208YS6-2-32]|uniref:DUF1236 domain-containing protein n=1 Tax=Fulvimarina uroteuthidis TaxID=3098149 RepID=A0ABU5I1G8_9HYPH|nr:DUF1236 domain-containing protein [Fulvimarina sp. 2208YS6-2-32]MDY8109192.1 DUF1236 domain-containing protein [Fulvimarina sp. 2208YS6-2-32]
MKRFTIAVALLASFGVLPASAQSTVSVVQYASNNPVADAAMPNPPSLGASVPSSVSLQSVEGAPNFGYFYFDGRPVIVDLRTRAIVKIGA